MIWEKTGSSLGSNRLYHANFEFMFVLSKGKHKTFNPIRDRKNVVSGLRTAPNSIKDGVTTPGRRVIVSGEFGKRNNIWKITPEQNRKGHPAPFPLQFATDHIVSWSNLDDLVFDPFGGSGTTAVAAENTGRRWLCTEISNEYSRKAIERIRAC